MKKEYATILFLAGLFAATARAEVPTQITRVTTVRPGTKRTVFWNAVHDKVKRYTLVMDVRAPRQVRPRKRQSEKGRQGNVEDHGRFREPRAVRR